MVEKKCSGKMATGMPMRNGVENSHLKQSSVLLRPSMFARLINYDYKHRKEFGLELEEKSE
jgi:hypothetical protein